MSGLMQRMAETWPKDWRPSDRLLARWVLDHGGSAGLAHWAGALGAAEGEGHTALALGDAERFGASLGPAAAEALDAPRWVGDGTGMTPFVRDGNERLYLWRYWQAERAVAARLAAMARQRTNEDAGPADAAPHPTRPIAFLAHRLDALFGGPGDGRDAAQRDAVRRCIDSRLFVLTGGPGTGKTSTVLRMLLARAAQGNVGTTVRVAAPTGKAAQRLVDALRAGQQQLGAQLADAGWRDAVAGFALPEASTVHRLLAYHPAENRYRRTNTDPLDADLVVIDEASMLDLETLAALLDALPPQAALWLVGDADQLSPVGPGSAFQDIVQVLEARAGAPVVRLTHSFRAEAGLQALNEALRQGDASPAQAFLAAPDALETALLDWATALAAETRTAPLPQDGAQAAATEALAALGERQWLCATREGPRGTLAINERLDGLMRAKARRASGDLDGADYPGRRLLITRNDSGTGLFNGDVGLVLAGADGRLRAWFAGPEGARAVPLGALPAHEPAFAMTVHKSQGSEYAEVAVLLPEDREHRVLSRELLYTAASRARRGLVLQASAEVVAAAVAKPVRRMGGLHARLEEAWAASTPVSGGGPG